MKDVIGAKAREAEKLLTDDGCTVKVINYTVDKQKEWDNMIVIRQRRSENTIELTASNFKLEI